MARPRHEVIDLPRSGAFAAVEALAVRQLLELGSYGSERVALYAEEEVFELNVWQPVPARNRQGPVYRLWSRAWLVTK
jgi:hypothetical protein